MSIGLIGKKLGMTQIYINDGEAVPVTVVDVAGNQVVQVKTVESDGYSAVQVGYGDKKPSRETKPLLGHFKKFGAEPKYVLHEFRATGELPAAGTKLSAEAFTKGQYVDVIGVTKGKGFQGVVKKFGFKGQPASHGSMMHRRPGSIGCRLTPGLVWKNKKMPGREGFDSRTTQNLEIIQSRPEEGLLLIKGAIPGHNGAYVIVRPSIKNKPPRKPPAPKKADAKKDAKKPEPKKK